LRLTLLPGGQYGIRHYPVCLYEHPLARTAAIQDFIDAIRKSKRPMCTVDESAKTVLACLAGDQSYCMNRPVTSPRWTPYYEKGAPIREPSEVLQRKVGCPRGGISANGFLVATRPSPHGLRK